MSSFERLRSCGLNSSRRWMACSASSWNLAHSLSLSLRCPTRHRRGSLQCQRPRQCWSSPQASAFLEVKIQGRASQKLSLKSIEKIRRTSSSKIHLCLPSFNLEITSLCTQLLAVGSRRRRQHRRRHAAEEPGMALPHVNLTDCLTLEYINRYLNILFKLLKSS